MGRTTVVAEPGCTHEGSLDAMFALVDLVAESGADAYKGQWCSDPEELCRRRHAPEYLPHYQHLRWPAQWHEQLAKRCEAVGLAYATTCYLPHDVAVVDSFTDFYKVAAFETGAADLLMAIASLQAGNEKRVVISLGLGATIGEVMASAPLLRPVWLRCVSAYPAPAEDLRLSTINEEGLDGLSDHTAAGDPDSLNVGALAVAAGATRIERHVRLESCRPSNPDYAVSLGGHQFAEYVRRIRVAERAYGSLKVAGPMPSETPMLRYRAQPRAARDDAEDR